MQAHHVFAVAGVAGFAVGLLACAAVFVAAKPAIVDAASINVQTDGPNILSGLPTEIQPLARQLSGPLFTLLGGAFANALDDKLPGPRSRTRATTPVTPLSLATQIL